MFFATNDLKRPKYFMDGEGGWRLLHMLESLKIGLIEKKAQ